MKITKNDLRKIILEEFEAASTSDATQAARELGAKGMRQGGVTDEERGIIAGLAKRLSAAGKKTNIASGSIARKIQHLVVELDKLLGPPAAETTPAAETEGE